MIRESAYNTHLVGICQSGFRSQLLRVDDGGSVSKINTRHEDGGKRANTTLEIDQELELAKLMVKDLEKLWKSYAKKALEAKLERKIKQVKKGFLNCETKEDLINMYGYAEIDEDTYRMGLDYFDKPQKITLLLIELHRNNIKDMLNNWRGTVKELEEELAPPEPKETVFERMDREEREASAENMRYQEAMARFNG